MTIATFFFLSAMCFIGAYFAIYVALRFHLVALGVAALAMFIPLFFVKHKRNQRFWKFEEQFPEAIDLIARALRAGHAFTTCAGDGS